MFRMLVINGNKKAKYANMNTLATNLAISARVISPGKSINVNTLYAAATIINGTTTNRKMMRSLWLTRSNIVLSALSAHPKMPITIAEIIKMKSCEDTKPVAKVIKSSIRLLYGINKNMSTRLEELYQREVEEIRKTRQRCLGRGQQRRPAQRN